MTISAALDKTVRLYRANFLPLVAIGVAGAVATMPLAFVTGQSESDVSTGIGLGLAVLILGVAMLFFLPWQYGSMMSASLAVIAGETPRPGAAFRAGWRRIGPLTGANFLGVMAGALAFPFLIIPGFYVWFGFSFAIAVIMDGQRRDERIGATDALKRSWALAKGLRGKIFGLYLVLALFQIVLSFLISGMLGLVGVEGVAREMAKQLSSTVVNPCYGLALGLLFVEARAHREGLDLAQQAERLSGGAASPGGVPAV